jgi:hypothetical protein
MPTSTTNYAVLEFLDGTGAPLTRSASEESSSWILVAVFRRGELRALTRWWNCGTNHGKRTGRVNIQLRFRDGGQD